MLRPQPLPPLPATTERDDTAYRQTRTGRFATCRVVTGVPAMA